MNDQLFDHEGSPQDSGGAPVGAANGAGGEAGGGGGGSGACDSEAAAETAGAFGVGSTSGFTVIGGT